jgi:cytosine/adenosine deaminase-related metal-dependent hydrolase
MHLAESYEELELLSSHSGPFVEMFAESGFWAPAAIPRGLRPLDFLSQLARAHRVLVIHGNYLTSDEISFLSENSEHMSVVYCPRTHAYFDHGRYPLVEMLAQGVKVALGTDSRASNPNLSLWEEMLFVAEIYPEIPRERALELGTISGAAALGRDREVGSLAPGKQADLCVIGLPDHEADPYELLLHGDCRVKATVLQGRLAWSLT